jgi:3,4-dihydroxy 2-butanone 4-phosphate synthase/GTP cyclohydrolase II
LAKTHDLLLQEETRPLAIALFGTPSLTVHLGFDQSNLASPDWYQQTGHPYVRAIAQILDALSAWPQLEHLEFMVSTGIDPLTGLQIQLDRQNFCASTLPSSVCDQLETQKIYSFSSRMKDAE